MCVCVYSAENEFGQLDLWPKVSYPNKKALPLGSYCKNAFRQLLLLLAKL